MNALLISDIHLTDSTSDRSLAFLEFLEKTVIGFDRLYILGDFFDAWVGTRAVFVKRFQPVLDRLQQWSRAGLQISYVEGNHDFCLGQPLAKSLGIRLHPDGFEENWEGRRVYLCHGDRLDTEDQGTLLLRSFLRSRAIQAAASIVPGNFLQYLASRSSHASRTYQLSRFRDENRIREKYRRKACELFDQGFDVVICGHTHVPDAYQTQQPGKRHEFYNIGDWVTHFSYLTFEKGLFLPRVYS